LSEKNELKEEGKMLAIEGIIRSKFGNTPLQSGDQAMAVLRSRKSQTASNRPSRHSTRHMPAVSSGFPARTFVAIIMGAILPMAIGICVFIYLKHVENSLPGNPKILFASQNAKVIRESKSLDLTEGMLLMSRDKIVTRNNERIEIKYEDGSHIAIEASSEATFTKNETSKKILVLNQGVLFAEISKQTSDSFFNFYTKNALVDVIGTSFDLSSINERTDLKMKTGKVKVTNLINKEEHFVQGGEQLTIGAKEIPVVAVKKIDLFQSHQSGLMALYHFSECHKNILSNLYSDTDLSLDFIIHKGSGLKPRKDNGVTVNMETYFANNSLKPLLNKFAKSDEFAIELWVRPNEEGIHSEDSLIFGAGMSESAMSNRNWLVYIGQTNGKIKGGLHTIGSQEKYLEIESKTSLDPKPTHIIFLKNKKGNLKLFVNGELSSEAIFDKSLIGWGEIISGNLLLGGTESGSHSWQGGFYLMAFYDKALTDEEVLASYQAGY
jgi:hypothetical protein